MSSGKRPSFEPWLPLDDDASCCDAAPLITTHDLSLRYGQMAAFEHVSLQINEGCITALVGPSGCGKTSFLNVLNRLTDLYDDCVVTGEARLGDIDILERRLDVTALRKRIGMVFQKPNPFPLSIRKNLDLPLREHGVRDRAERIESALKDVALWDEVKDRLDKSALSLSGGQQQRLCIARAMVLEPQVLLMDEPCSSLDPLSSGAVEDLIASLRHRYAVLIVTHNLAQARRIADWGALFWTQDGVGRLIEYGAIKQIFEEPKEELTKAYVRGRRG